MRFVIAVIAGLMILGMGTAASAYEETREFNLDAGGIDMLDVDCGAGGLEILGREGLREITVHATIVIDDLDRDDARELIDDNVQLALEKRGDRAVLISHIDVDSFGFFSSIFHDANGRIDLLVEVPSGLDVTVDDGSGSMEIRDIGDADITDGSGETTIIGAGRVDIHDGSGGLSLSDIGGSVYIDDGSGEISLSHANGDIRIDDGSGGIDIENVIGDIDIDDSSGGIAIRGVDGRVLISDGSGSIDVRRVTKDVIVRDDGSGGISLHDIEGKVQTPE